MSRILISQGSKFESEIGYSRALVDGEMVYVSGTTGYNYVSMEISEDVVEQARQCLENIKWALRRAGGKMEDIVRVHYILPNAEDFPKCWPVLHENFDGIRPAATMFSAELADPKMKIEIEVTARLESI